MQFYSIYSRAVATEEVHCFSYALGTSGILTPGKRQWKINAFGPFEKSSLYLADTVIGDAVICKVEQSDSEKVSRFTSAARAIC